MGKDFTQHVRDEMERAYRPTSHVESSEMSDSLPEELYALRSALLALRASYASVGQRPPEPPTLRGRIGALLVHLVQRMLFWYTPQIVHFQYSALRVLEEQAKILERAESRIRFLETELSHERARNEDLRPASEGRGITPASKPRFKTANADARDGRDT